MEQELDHVKSEISEIKSLLHQLVIPMTLGKVEKTFSLEEQRQGNYEIAVDLDAINTTIQIITLLIGILQVGVITLRQVIG